VQPGYLLKTLHNSSIVTCDLQRPTVLFHYWNRNLHVVQYCCASQACDRHPALQPATGTQRAHGLLGFFSHVPNKEQLAPSRSFCGEFVLVAALAALDRLVDRPTTTAHCIVWLQVISVSCML
jgi:hypothetical protein